MTEKKRSCGDEERVERERGGEGGGVGMRGSEERRGVRTTELKEEGRNPRRGTDDGGTTNRGVEFERERERECEVRHVV